MSKATAVVKTEEPKEVALVSLMSPAQELLLAKKTPANEIQWREGRGGKKLAYVEIGYVTDVLNDIFGYDWDFEIVEEQIGSDKIWVRGKLTVRFHTENGVFPVIRTNYGGQDIAKSKSDGRPVDIGDDLKAAAADCLKKCASMLGVAKDVYRGEVSQPSQASTSGYSAQSSATTASQTGSRVETNTDEACPNCGVVGLVRAEGISKAGKHYSYLSCKHCGWKPF